MSKRTPLMDEVHERLQLSIKARRQGAESVWRAVTSCGPAAWDLYSGEADEQIGRMDGHLFRALELLHDAQGPPRSSEARPWPEPDEDGDIVLPGEDLGPVLAELETWAARWFPHLLPLDDSIGCVIEGLDCATAVNLLVFEFDFPRCTSLVLALARGCAKEDPNE